MVRFHRSNRPQRGFSLVELAIVVGVTGLLFGGLWRLMSSGNSQLREQTAADQMNQLVSATRSFMAGQQGQTLLTGLGVNGVAQLQLPAAAATAAGTGGCGAALTALQGQPVDTFCNFLPTGFWVGAGGTTNSYGQSYQVFVRKDANAAGTPAQNYDFLILTTGGDVIPDSSGGRIAANLGSNGGFLFSNNNCGAPANTTACGAFGSYNLSLAAGGPYGAIAGAASGHIVTQNSSTLSAATNTQWLARVAIAGDTAVPPLFNTMNVPLNMRTGGAAILNMFGNDIWLNNNTAANGGGTIRLQEGTIQGPGQININNSALLTSAITINQAGAGNLSSSVRVSNSVQASTAVDITSLAACDPQATPATCNLGLNVTGSANISAFLNANQMRAGTFIYVSDMRLKRDIAKIPNALDEISKLQGYRFTWKKDGRSDVGLLAQEVAKVYPELVHTAAAGGNLGVEYGNLIAPLIEAVKELRAQNIAMSKRLENQEREITRLRNHRKKPAVEE